MRALGSMLLVLALSTTSVLARASTWYPIDTGHIWVYATHNGPLQTVMVGAPESFSGVLVQPFVWDSGAREYLSRDESGRVHLHGVAAPDGSYVVFDPPVMRMDSHLEVGHTWETLTDAIQHTAAGVEFRREQWRSAYHVLAIGSVVVPAGTFLAAEIARTEEAASSAGAVMWAAPSIESSVLLADWLAPSRRYAFRESYVEGIGWVRRTDESASSVLFALAAYGEDGVRSGASSWGGVKAGFGR